ncbi:hypothetical protein FOMPIDRAFT_1054297 [Fomitopsis schrenkii]|uniref:Uncharacterized protein n=1 Tax=Fomitopsis schrenkii TaxID=2126942 RepID=S8DVU5_FOMSC|nr:hypothetical protein FOMPIDRAFT_1054297 [Fomitopsis schrenkii]
MVKFEVEPSCATAEDSIVEAGTRPFTRSVAAKQRKNREKVKQTVAQLQDKTQTPRRRPSVARPTSNKSRRCGVYKHLPPTPPRAGIRGRQDTVRRRGDLSVAGPDDGLSDTDADFDMEDDADSDSNMSNASASQEAAEPYEREHSAQVDAGFFHAPAADRPADAQQLGFDAEEWALPAQYAAPQAVDAARNEDMAALLNMPDPGFEAQGQQHVAANEFNPPLLDYANNLQLPDYAHLNPQIYGYGNQHLDYRYAGYQNLGDFGNNFYGAGNQFMDGAAQPHYYEAPPPPFVPAPFYVRDNQRVVQCVYPVGPPPPFVPAPAQPPVADRAQLYVQADPQAFMAAPAQPLPGAGNQNLFDHHPIQEAQQQHRHEEYVPAPQDNAQLDFNAMRTRFAAEAPAAEASGSLAGDFSVSSTLRSPSPPSIAAALGGSLNDNQPQAGPSRIPQDNSRASHNSFNDNQPQAGPSRLQQDNYNYASNDNQPQAGPSRIPQDNLPAATQQRRMAPRAAPADVQPEAGPSGTRHSTPPRSPPAGRAGPSGSNAPPAAAGVPSANAEADDNNDGDDNGDDDTSEAALNFEFKPRNPRERIPRGRRYRRADGAWVDEIVDAPPLIGLAFVGGNGLHIPKDGELTMSWQMRIRHNSAPKRR